MADDLTPPVAEVAAPAMSPEECSAWKSRLAASREFLQPVIDQGKRNVQRQKQKFFESVSSVDRIAAPDDFFLSQQKIAKLFYRVPEVQLSAKRPEFEPAAPLFQSVLNEYLGPEHINIKVTIDEMLTDLITAVGFGACKIGYTATLTDVPQTDPSTGIAISGPDGQPLMQKSLVRETYECSRVPPGRMIFDPTFIGSDFDKSAYIGFTLIEDVPPTTEHAQTTQVTEQNELLSQPPTEAANTSRTYIIVDAVWFKGLAFGVEGVIDPEEIWEFEWVRGANAPRKYRKCQYKNFPGFPVKVVTTHYISDTAIPPSDTTITRNIVDAKSIGLSTELTHSQRVLPQNLVDTSRVDGDTLQKIEANVSDAFIGVGMPVTEDLVRPLIKGQLPNDHYALQERFDRLISASWSMGASQIGAKEQGTHTATEIATVSSAMDTRLGYEQDKAGVFFLTKMVRPIAALLQQYAPETGGYVRVLGKEGGAQLAQWNAALIQGDFAFSIKVNSQARPDSQADLKKTTDWVNYSAKSPYVNQKRNWQLAAEAFGFDPFGGQQPLIVDPPPPKQDPPPLSLKGDDLNPLMPQYPNVYAIMKQFWDVALPIAPMPVAAPAALLPTGAPPNALTPGTADEADVLTKHTDTGHLPGGASEVAQGTKAKGLLGRIFGQGG